MTYHQLPLIDVAEARRRAPRLRFCVCGHQPQMHGDKGKGACEGLHTPLDGPYAAVQPCDCGAYQEEKR